MTRNHASFGATGWDEPTRKPVYRKGRQVGTLVRYNESGPWSIEWTMTHRKDREAVELQLALANQEAKRT